LPSRALSIVSGLFEPPTLACDTTL
jgi:hypothetical protein